MGRIGRTPLAKTDAVEIWCYVAKDSEAAADGLIDRIEERLTMLANHPEAGETVAYIRPDVRRSSLGNYVIYYKPLNDGITVLRILHAARRHEDQV